MENVHANVLNSEMEDHYTYSTSFVPSIVTPFSCFNVINFISFKCVLSYFPCRLQDFEDPKLPKLGPNSGRTLLSYLNQF